MFELDRRRRSVSVLPPTGSAVAPGRSVISGLRSSTSNTRSKLTSAVRKLTCMLVSWLIGPYSLVIKTRQGHEGADMK